MTVSRVLFATNNQHKISELREILSSLPVSLVSPRDTGIRLEVEETGRTYAANAALKARAFAAASGLIALADDSGLEVKALGGAPGVFSARYAGQGASSRDRYNLLLKNLAGVPWEQRQARFVAVIAIAVPDGRLVLCRGQCSGVITFEPQGEGGFGYDPVFYMPRYRRTMAELPDALKNRISHRARAGAKARAALPYLLAEPPAGPH